MCECYKQGKNLKEFQVPNKCEDSWLFLCQHSHIQRPFLTSVVIARSCEALVLFGFPGTLLCVRYYVHNSTRIQLYVLLNTDFFLFLRVGDSHVVQSSTPSVDTPIVGNQVHLFHPLSKAQLRAADSTGMNWNINKYFLFSHIYSNTI